MKVLVVDDNEEVSEMISFCLKGKGIPCKTVNQGKEGLEVIKNENFDAIILDLAMPEFSGYDIIKSLKNDDLLKSKNIVVCTASAVGEHDIDEILSLGIKTVLRKPFALPELMSAIEKFNGAK